jgi:hypothetical protein
MGLPPGRLSPGPLRGPDRRGGGGRGSESGYGSQYDGGGGGGGSAPTSNYTNIIPVGYITNLTWTDALGVMIPADNSANLYELKWTADFSSDHPVKVLGTSLALIYVGGIVVNPISGLFLRNSQSRAFLIVDGIGARHITIAGSCVFRADPGDACSNIYRLKVVTDDPTGIPVYLHQANMTITYIEPGCWVDNFRSDWDSVPNEYNFMHNIDY